MNNITYRTIESANAQVNLLGQIIRNTTFGSDVYNWLRNDILNNLVWTQDYLHTYLDADYRVDLEEERDLHRRCTALSDCADYIHGLEVKDDAERQNVGNIEYALRALVYTLYTVATCFRRLDY